MCNLTAYILDPREIIRYLGGRHNVESVQEADCPRDTRGDSRGEDMQDEDEGPLGLDGRFYVGVKNKSREINGSPSADSGKRCVEDKRRADEMR